MNEVIRSISNIEQTFLNTQYEELRNEAIVYSKNNKRRQNILLFINKGMLKWSEFLRQYYYKPYEIKHKYLNDTPLRFSQDLKDNLAMLLTNVALNIYKAAGIC